LGLGLLLVQLVACGFHLRGDVSLPPSFTDMAVVDGAPPTDMAAELRTALKGQGIRLVTDAAQAKTVLQVHGETFGKRVSAVGREGKAQEYRLTYSVNFSLRGPDGQWWLSKDQVTVQRDLRFDETAVLGVSQEEAQLRKEMQREAASQILRRLQHAKPPATTAEEPAP
jgi:LPS-assembly lipoprotein